jgi:hypothetical protein
MLEKVMDQNKEFNNLEALRIEYEKLIGKYDLPSFSELNEMFDIEEIDLETEFLLRRVRRVVAEKVTNYLRFIEIILNPSNSPLFFFNFIKKLNNKDKEVLSKLYEELGKVEVEIIALDLEYSEKNEAEFIKRLYNVFKNKLRVELLAIIRKLSEENNDKKKEINGSYFG